MRHLGWRNIVSTAWVDTSRMIKMMEYVGTNLLKNNYLILKEKFLETPVFVEVDIAQDTRATWCYMGLLQAGIVEFWSEAKWAAMEDDWTRLLRDKVGISEETEYDRERTASAITLLDTLVQESYLLYGIGIVFAVVVWTWTPMQVVYRKIRRIVCSKIKKWEH